MRVTTYSAYQNAIVNLQQRQQGLQKTQEQLTTGKRVAKPSDDPVAAARAERALAEMTRADAHQRALEAARLATQLAETALGDAGEVIQQARETLLAAGNPSYGDGERRALVLTLQGLRKQLLGIANRSDGAGNFLFGGQGTEAPPFVEDPTGQVVYQGSPGDTRVASSERMSLSLDGERTWLAAPTGNAPPAPPSISVFDVLDTAIARLSVPGASDADVALAVREGVSDLDICHAHQLAARASAGEALNRMDQVELRIADAKLAAQTDRSSAEDLDLVQAISDFQNRQTGYDAALRAYSMVQRLSLFNYISG